MAIKKCVAVQLGVIYDSSATNRKQGELPVRAPLPPCHTPIGRPGVIQDSQPAEIRKTPPKTGGSSYFLIEKPPTELFFKIKTFNKIEDILRGIHRA
jgi:hypothetical protein